MKAGWVSGAGAACRSPYMWRCEMGERIEKKAGARFGSGESLEFESGAVDGSENRYPDKADEGRLGE